MVGKIHLAGTNKIPLKKRKKPHKDKVALPSTRTLHSYPIAIFYPILSMDLFLGANRVHPLASAIEKRSSSRAEWQYRP